MSSLPSETAPEPGLVRCPACGGASREPVLRLPDLPVDLNSQRSPSDAASAARGPIDLVICCTCAHIYNRAFDPALITYSTAYENTLHYSAEFRAFAEALADRLVADHGLAGRTVVEVGCGPGHFLSMLCERGVASGLGFDPSYDRDRLGAPHHPAVLVRREVLRAGSGLSADLAVSQHVLEHLEEPLALLGVMREVAGRRGRVYSEVPNGELMIDQAAVWDVLYEHVSYFTPISLQAALTGSGLKPTAVGSAFGDQFLWADAAWVDAEPERPPGGQIEALVERSRAFGLAATASIEAAGTDLGRYRRKGPVVVWGAGTKGMTFLNLVPGTEEVSAVVDINPRKRGHGVPGTSHAITGPEGLRGIGTATVLIANPMYGPEIARQVAELGLDATIVPLWGESPATRSI